MVEPGVEQRAPHYVWRNAADWHFVGAVLILLVTVALSWLSYRLVEYPGMKLGYRIGRWIMGYPPKTESRA